MKTICRTVLFGFVVAAQICMASDFVLTNGTTLRDAKVIDAQVTRIKVIHSKGVAWYDVATLDDATQNHLATSRITYVYSSSATATSREPTAEEQKYTHQLSRLYAVETNGVIVSKNAIGYDDIQGNVLNILEDGCVLLISGSKVVAVDGISLYGLVDEDHIAVCAKKTGQFEYVTVMGARKIVARYRAISPLDVDDVHRVGLSWFPEYPEMKRAQKGKVEEDDRAQWNAAQKRFEEGKLRRVKAMHDAAMR